MTEFDFGEEGDCLVEIVTIRYSLMPLVKVVMLIAACIGEPIS